MPNELLENEPAEGAAGLSRRSAVLVGAWSAPVIVLGTALPAAAASMSVARVWFTVSDGADRIGVGEPGGNSGGIILVHISGTSAQSVQLTLSGPFSFADGGSAAVIPLSGGQATIPTILATGFSTENGAITATVADDQAHSVFASEVLSTLLQPTVSTVGPRGVWRSEGGPAHFTNLPSGLTAVTASATKNRVYIKARNEGVVLAVGAGTIKRFDLDSYRSFYYDAAVCPSMGTDDALIHYSGSDWLQLISSDDAVDWVDAREDQLSSFAVSALPGNAFAGSSFRNSFSATNGPSMAMPYSRSSPSVLYFGDDLLSKSGADGSFTTFDGSPHTFDPRTLVASRKEGPEAFFVSYNPAGTSGYSPMRIEESPIFVGNASTSAAFVRTMPPVTSGIGVLAVSETTAVAVSAAGRLLSIPLELSNNSFVQPWRDLTTLLPSGVRIVDISASTGIGTNRFALRGSDGRAYALSWEGDGTGSPSVIAIAPPAGGDFVQVTADGGASMHFLTRSGEWLALPAWPTSPSTPTAVESGAAGLPLPGQAGATARISWIAWGGAEDGAAYAIMT